MTLAYYNAIADALFIVESDNAPGMSLYYSLVVTNKKAGWIFRGEL